MPDRRPKQSHGKRRSTPGLRSSSAVIVFDTPPGVKPAHANNVPHNMGPHFRQLHWPNGSRQHTPHVFTLLRPVLLFYHFSNHPGYPKNTFSHLLPTSLAELPNAAASGLARIDPLLQVDVIAKRHKAHGYNMVLKGGHRKSTWEVHLPIYYSPNSATLQENVSTQRRK